MVQKQWNLNDIVFRNQKWPNVTIVRGSLFDRWRIQRQDNMESKKETYTKNEGVKYPHGII